ncbi:16S rRNA (guanine(966)-N(2))-methyltransferase RsmD [Alteribacillus iranensis]|uniref:16S rRNA (Guanine(966)-N(2))-methyltransferase RsmD n=2 Tax=Alteribacillus iranensis TaxID=930128 RepID=A0A1I2AC85_9BACI|nr:16S rRNA (guanine(966)-N(2))-methyltransferase RsmD [Alteribacillus iranensis]
MRIISGDYKGRTIKAVPGMKTRPTSDKVKESLFNRIGPYFDGGAVLDLYAGTGNLGIEALSRGCDTCVFIDQSSQAVRVVKHNIKNLGIMKNTEVYRNDAKRALYIMGNRKRSFDLIFLDPPYAKEQLSNIVEIIEEQNLLTEEGQIVCEHHSETVLPEDIQSFRKSQAVTYGDTGITIYTY